MVVMLFIRLPMGTVQLLKLGNWSLKLFSEGRAGESTGQEDIGSN